ncbi:MAG TPA: AIR synthase-related protein [Solirubrobacteraceae bacterium]|nr:AIR synthase-related protein [Solirubrobacteraceae bacterium]
MSSTEKRGEQAYRDAGVDYEVLDAGKRLAIKAALATSAHMESNGGKVLEASRGESAFVFRAGEETLALVMEGLGTKSIIARTVAEKGRNHFDAVAYDTVAAILNDLCCVGARPLVVNAYFSTGRPEWFENQGWYERLIEGWFRACGDAQCTWGGGESPSLPELVSGEDIELAGSAVGRVPGGQEAILGEDLDAGNEIVLVASSGLHANGSSLARMIASNLEDGYDTRLPSGETLGDALLAPSIIYSELVGNILDAGLPVTYMSHITGHGFLKLMRPAHELTYRISQLLPVPAVLTFLAEKAEMSTKTAYSTFNMGHGFAIYCEKDAGEKVVSHATAKGLTAVVAGRVEAGERRVVVEPLGIEYRSDELRLGPEG